MTVVTAAAFAVAAALGGIVRWQAGRLNRPVWPLGTFTVNVVAAFAAGVLTTVSPTASVIVVTAFLGSMSTFSTLIGEMTDLIENRGQRIATGYLVATMLAGVGSAALGMSLT